MWSKVVAKKHRAWLWIVSGPSGSGKTTLCERLLRKKSLNIVSSISFTTRSLRRGEKNNRDYFFISKKDFLKKIKKGDFLEWKKVFSNFYGTPKNIVFDLLKKNKDVLLSIDVKGALEVQKKYPRRSILIFVLPPNEKVLAKRAKERAREDRVEIKRRLAFAKTEISFAKKYNYIVVNDNLKKAIRDLESIIITKRLENDLYPTRKNNR
ncbi:MAG: guanylate kinase [Candidatus Omnitrophota bacterium]